MLQHSKTSTVTWKDVPFIYHLKCLKCQNNLSITRPRPSFRPRREQTERSGPHALLAVQTEPHDRTHLSKQMMRCVHKHGTGGTGVQAVYPLNIRECLFDSQCSFACCFFCTDTINSAGAEIGHITKAFNQQLPDSSVSNCRVLYLELYLEKIWYNKSQADITIWSII